jgi:hypothetical protein
MLAENPMLRNLELKRSQRLFLLLAFMRFFSCNSHKAKKSALQEPFQLSFGKKALFQL